MRKSLSTGLLVIVSLCGLMTVLVLHPDSFTEGQISPDEESVKTQCTPARILYMNLQPTAYNRSGELPEIQEMRAAGFSVNFANRNSTKTISKTTLDGYNVLWLQNGCAGQLSPLKESEVNTVKDFYLKGGSLILAAGDDTAGGIYGPPGSDCQSRVNKIATNLGVSFSGKITYPPNGASCRPIQGGGHPLLSNVTLVFRETSGEMNLAPTVLWGKSKPVTVGTIDETNAPVLAAISKEDGHGGVIFTPQDQGFKAACTGSSYTMYKNIFSFLGHAHDCAPPSEEVVATPIAGGTCQRLERSLYGTGSVKVTCPAGTVIMGGGWDNGAGEKFDESSPLELGHGWQCQRNLEASGGSCVAICCSTAYYESIVSFKSSPLADRPEPFCAQGSVLVGGGFTDSVTGRDEDILRPNTAGNGWLCYDDQSTTGTQSRCFAICARRKETNDALTCKTVSLSAPQDTGATVECPDGTFVTGGGFEDKSTSNHDQDKSLPTPEGTGWTCMKEGNTKAGTGGNICFARCCSLPQGIFAGTVATLSSVASAQPSSVSSVPASSEQVSSAEAVTSVASTAQSSVIPLSVASSSSFSLVSEAFSAPASSSSSSFVSSLMRSAIPVSSSTIPASRSSSSPSSSAASSSAVIASSSSKAPACPADACVLGGKEYCEAFRLGCGAIADDPCFVCLAEIGGKASAVSFSSVAVAVASLESNSSSISAAVQSSSTTPAPLTAVLSPLQPETIHTGAPIASHAPVGATGPASLAFMAAGAAGGIGWIRKRKKPALPPKE